MLKSRPSWYTLQRIRKPVTLSLQSRLIVIICPYSPSGKPINTSIVVHCYIVIVLCYPSLLCRSCPFVFVRCLSTSVEACRKTSDPVSMKTSRNRIITSFIAYRKKYYYITCNINLYLIKASLSRHRCRESPQIDVSRAIYSWNDLSQNTHTKHA